MAVQTSYPGVYIDEFAPGAPIQGVSTSHAAFIGVAAKGDIEKPQRVTSFDQFKRLFGNLPVGGYYLWYAVRGFFQNEGNYCYIVRASNGKAAEVTLPDRAGNGLATVRAAQPGSAGNNLTLTVSAVNRLQGSLYQPTGNYTIIGSRTIDLTDDHEAAQFRPGDWADLGNAGSRIQIVSVSGKRLRLGSDATGAAGSSGAIRLANAPAGSQVFRIEAASNQPPQDILVPGAIITINPGANGRSALIDDVQIEWLATQTPIATYRVTLREGFNTPIALNGGPVPLQTEEFNLQLSAGGVDQPPYQNLSIDPEHPRYFVQVVNDDPQSAIQVVPVTPPPLDQLPFALPQNGAINLQNGTDEQLPALNVNDYVRALDTLRRINDVNLVAVPDAVTIKTSGTPAKLDEDAIANLQQQIIAHCELLADRFAVLDAMPNLELFGASPTKGIDDQRNTLDSARGYAALYYPWIKVARPLGSDPALVPPSGHVCGLMARTDAGRGVFKAAAGDEAYVDGAFDVERTMSDAEQGELNLRGINVIRVFRAGGRPIVWGARTTATNTNWQYVSVRRLFLFLERSIQQGIHWAVFEPNNTELWQKLKRTIVAFLREQWQEGALFGAKETDAYYVKIDEDINPFSERELGRLHIEIGIQPAYPAEFIIVRIGIWDGGASISET